MEASSTHGRRARRRAGAVAAALAATGLAACGGGERQDADEPERRFELELLEASLPRDQKLAKRSELVIRVRNAGDRTVPNLAVTVDGLDERKDDPDLADPWRPVFAVNGTPKEIGDFPEAKDATPLGCDTAYVNTWACGRLPPGADRTLRWSVTAVRAGPYRISYVVAGGLDGGARAVEPGGGKPSGSFSGTISDEAPDTRVADDGRTVVSGAR